MLYHTSLKVHITKIQDKTEKKQGIIKKRVGIFLGLRAKYEKQATQEKRAINQRYIVREFAWENAILERECECV